MRTSWFFLGLLACGSGKEPGPPGGGPTPLVDTDAAETDVPNIETDLPPEDTDVPVPKALFGTVPPVALPAPDFTEVVNYDLALRSKADLLGHPTVLWFYPAAGTGG